MSLQFVDEDTVNVNVIMHIDKMDNYNTPNVIIQNAVFSDDAFIVNNNAEFFGANVTLSDTRTEILNTSDDTKKLKFDLDDLTTNTTTVLSFSSNGILTNTIDTKNAETLFIGPTNATKVEIADTGVVTEIQGPLNLTGETLGDILVSNGSALNFLAVGSDEQVLKANSSATLGVAWGDQKVFGDFYTYGSSDGQSTTTSGSYQQKLNITTPSLPSGGTYRIGYTFEIGCDVKEKIWRYRVRIDDSTLVSGNIDNASAQDDTFYLYGGFYVTTLSSGTHDIDIDYRSDEGETVRIRDARLEFFRVS